MRTSPSVEEKVYANTCVIAALQTSQKQIEKSIIEILQLARKSDYQIFKEFQYQKWTEIPLLIRQYLASRFDLLIPSNDKTECCNAGTRMVWAHSYVGQTFEKYKILENISDPATKLLDLSVEELSGAVELMIEVLNKKKGDIKNDQ